jgi:hypothetical protein
MFMVYTPVTPHFWNLQTCQYTNQRAFPNNKQSGHVHLMHARYCRRWTNSVWASFRTATILGQSPEVASNGKVCRPLLPWAVKQVAKDAWSEACLLEKRRRFESEVWSQLRHCFYTCGKDTEILMFRPDGKMLFIDLFCELLAAFVWQFSTLLPKSVSDRSSSPWLVVHEMSAIRNQQYGTSVLYSYTVYGSRCSCIFISAAAFQDKPSLSHHKLWAHKGISRLFPLIQPWLSILLNPGWSTSLKKMHQPKTLDIWTQRCSPNRKVTIMSLPGMFLSQPSQVCFVHVHAFKFSFSPAR